MPIKVLRLVVIVLGIAVVAAFGVLVAVIAQKGGRGVEEAPEARGAIEPPLVAAERAPWGRVGLDQPAGTRIQSVVSSGEFILLHLYTGAPGQDERVVVLDPANGQVVGTFAVGAR